MQNRPTSLAFMFFKSFMLRNNRPRFSFLAIFSDSLKFTVLNKLIEDNFAGYVFSKTDRRRIDFTSIMESS